jgi:hypothetical protein
MTARNLSYLLAATCIPLTSALAQPNYRSPSDAHAAQSAGGRVTPTPDLVDTPVSLEMLVHMSTLIIDGAVSEVLPAVHPDPIPTFHLSKPTRGLL